MTTSYFYSYIETSSYQTTYTITLKARQSRYSLTGEWLESNDGRNWGKVTSTTGRDGQSCSSSQVRCFERQVCYYDGNGRWLGCEQYNVIDCSNGGCFGPQSPTASQLASSLTANGRQIVGFNPPIILYFTANESIAVSAGRISYTVSGVNWSCTQQELGYTTECVESREVCTTFAGGIVGCRTECLKYKSTSYYQCVQQYTEWSRTYQLQAIELVDWDTGEVYASVNQTSLTFNIYRNTIVRFKYVLTSSWSRTWEVIIWTRPPPSNPADCQQILNSGLPGTWEWCSCAKMLYDPRYDQYCKNKCTSYFVVNFYPCCSGGRRGECIQSCSGPGVLYRTPPYDCDNPPAPQEITLSVQASWTPAPGWRYHDWGWDGDGVSCSLTVTGNSASGSCKASIPPDKSARIVIIFVKS